jgi:hypothetical protein
MSTDGAIRRGAMVTDDARKARVLLRIRVYSVAASFASVLNGNGWKQKITNSHALIDHARYSWLSVLLLLMPIVEEER